MALLSNAAVLLGKELRTEFRSRELLTTTMVFILTIVVLFSFTFDPSVTESRRFGPGLLWLAFLFAASLMLQPCFLREQNNDTLSALRLAVSDPFAIFLAKLAANTLFLLFTQVLLLPAFSILYNVPILGHFLNWCWSCSWEAWAFRLPVRLSPQFPRRPECANCSCRCCSCHC